MMSALERQILIRNASPADAHALAGLLEELGFPARSDDVRRRLDRLALANETVFVAENHAEVLGFVAVHVTPVLHRRAPVGRLTALVVTSRARGFGYGRALVAA